MNQKQPKINLSIEELERMLEEKRRATKTSGKQYAENKEMVKEALKKHIAEQTSTRSLTAASDNDEGDSSQKETEIIMQAREVQSIPEQDRLQKIVNIAFQKDVYHAVKVAETVNDFYLLDALHDFLAGHFNDLLERRKVKKL